MGRNIKGEFQLTQRVMGVKVELVLLCMYVMTLLEVAQIWFVISCVGLWMCLIEKDNSHDWTCLLSPDNNCGENKNKLYLLSLLIKSAKKYLPR